MAFAIGTATGFIDMARKLRDFADGTLDPAIHVDFTAGGAVPGAEQWTTETNGGGQPSLPGTGNASDGEVYMTGPGGGADEIHVQWKTYRDTSLFNWEIRGATGFSNSTPFESQLQVSAAAHHALANSSMNVWFFVNGRRMMAVAQSGTTFTLCYMGFLKQFAAASQWPYPLFVSGSVISSSIPISTNNYQHSCLPDVTNAAARVRWADGTWLEVANYTGSTSKSHATTRCVWPYSVATIANPDISGSGGSHSPREAINPAVIWQGFTSATPRISSGFTGDRVLFPCTLMFDNTSPSAQAVGELDGLFAVFGESGLSAGDTITVGSDTYIVFQNTWRSEFADFFAVKRE